MRHRVTWLAGVAALAVTACGAPSEDEREELREQAGEAAQTVREAAREAADRVEDAAGEAAEAVRDGAEDARRVAGDAMEAAEPRLDAAVEAVEEFVSPVDEARLEAVLAHPRRDEDRARDGARHPQEVMAFFGIAPSDTVVEVLPGGGWYTRVLAPYLAEEGRYAALNYSMAMMEQLFGDRLSDERRADMAAFPQTWPAKVAEFSAEEGEEPVDVLGAYFFGGVPEEAEGAADAVLFIRALHNLERAGLMDDAIADAAAILKPGGVVGVVQHSARDTAPDAYVDGSNGYLRQTRVVEAFEAGGFTLVAESDVNANPKDTTDYPNGVWTLPPVLGTGENEEDYRAIGESNRMTLLFRKDA